MSTDTIINIAGVAGEVLPQVPTTTQEPGILFSLRQCILAHGAGEKAVWSKPSFAAYEQRHDAAFLRVCDDIQGVNRNGGIHETTQIAVRALGRSWVIDMAALNPRAIFALAGFGLRTWLSHKAISRKTAGDMEEAITSAFRQLQAGQWPQESRKGRTVRLSNTGPAKAMQAARTAVQKLEEGIIQQVKDDLTRKYGDKAIPGNKLAKAIDAAKATDADYRKAQENLDMAIQHYMAAGFDE